jgi:hypothetical protein
VRRAALGHRRRARLRPALLWEPSKIPLGEFQHGLYSKTLGLAGRLKGRAAQKKGLAYRSGMIFYAWAAEAREAGLA